jgi:hypothetical protein
MTSLTNVNVRDATLDDLDAIVILTRDRRDQLETWEPRYWKKREGTDVLHPHFLKYCLDHEAIRVVCTEDDHGVVIGCLIAHPATRGRVWVDDVCVPTGRWNDVGAAMMTTVVATPGFVCVPTNDREMVEWFSSVGRQRRSIYRNVWLDSITLNPPAYGDELPIDIGVAPEHSFENQINPIREKSLVVSTDEGFAIGSTPLTPPAYDPGGTTTVIDRIVAKRDGGDRSIILMAALAECHARGDVQAIVIHEPADTELSALLDAFDAGHPVDVWSTR